jgi:hypothetical protein
VADQQHVEREDAGGLHHRLQQLVSLLGGRTRPYEPQALADAVYVGVHGQGRLAAGEEQDAGGGLRSHAAQGAQEGAPLVQWNLTQKIEIQLADALLDLIQDRLYADALHVCQSADADRIGDLLHRRGAHRVPVPVELLHQACKRTIGIKVGRVLREHRLDQLG